MTLLVFSNYFMSISLTALGSITPVEQGGTERYDLGHGVLVGNGQLPIITIEATGNGYLAFINGQWVMDAGSPSSGGFSNLTAVSPLAITNNTINFAGTLPVSNGGTGVTSLPTGILKSDGNTIVAAIANLDYVLPGFSVDGGIY